MADAPLAAAPLTGLGILVTRPAAQAEGLMSRINALGGLAVALPGLEIASPSDPHALAQRIGRLRHYDLIIFISPTAVEQAWPFIIARHGDWPHGFMLAAVGPGSARALTRLGARRVLLPEDGADSEHLLALPELQALAGKQVLIVRGEGGREHLAQGLRDRGAEVDHAECYRRVRPSIDPAPVLELWRQGRLMATTVTSTEILDNLFDLLGDEGGERLRTTPMFVPHPRIEAAAQQRGALHTRLCPAGDDGLVDGLIDWARHAR